MNKNSICKTILATGIVLSFGSTAVQAEKLVFAVSASQGSLQYRTAEKFADTANNKFKRSEY